MNNQSIRRDIIQKRQQLSSVQQIVASKKIMQQVYSLTAIKYSKYIACYVAVDHEVDCSAVMNYCWQRAKKCYLPRIHHAEQLKFVNYQSKDKLILNRFGIPEPYFLQNRLLVAPLLDIVITPLIAFNAQGFRLGTGGGYYDKTFAFKKDSLKKNPLLIGVAYEFQKTDFEIQSWDIPLEYVVTEKNIYRFKSSQQ